MRIGRLLILLFLSPALRTPAQDATLRIDAARSVLRIAPYSVTTVTLKY